MLLYLTYQPPGGQPQTIWLKPSQTLVVGRSPECDLSCPYDPRISLTHFQLQFEESGWTARPLSSAAVYVDDNPTGASFQMDDCHSVRAGDTVFQIRIEGGNKPAGEATVAPAPAVVAPEPTPEPQIPFAWTQLSPISLEVQCDPIMQSQLLQSISQGYNLYAAVNQLRLKRPVDGLPLVGDDLFEQAPEEIRATDSLHLIPVPLDQLAALSQKLLDSCRSDGVSLLIAQLPLEAIIKEMKILWAWYSRPSLLRFHLQHGTKFLTDKLLAHPRCLVLAQPDDANHLHLFACKERLAELTQQIDQFAQSHAPANTGQ